MTPKSARKLLHLLILSLVISGMNISTISHASSHGISQLILASDDHAHEAGVMHSHKKLAEDSQMHDAGSHFHDTPSHVLTFASTLIEASAKEFPPISIASPFRSPDRLERPPRKLFKVFQI